MLTASLRPQSWSDFIDQERITTIVQQAIRASRERGELLDHLFLYGPSGLGKTALAYLVASGSLKVLHGSQLEARALAYQVIPGSSASMTRWPTRSRKRRGQANSESSVAHVFIDEIHAMDRAAQIQLIEILDNSAKTRKGFTLIGATTEPAEIITPLRNRFGLAFRLEFYGTKDLAHIARNSAKALGIELEAGADLVVASRGRGVPRVVNNLLKRIRDTNSKVSRENAIEILDSLGIDSWGLGPDERSYLVSLLVKFKGGPAGLSTLAGSMAESDRTLKEFYEPFLLRLGLVQITSRGRVITELGHKYLQEQFLG